MKKQLVRAAAASVLGLSLMTGFAAADITNTGPGSDNDVRVTTHVRHTVRNDNDVRLTNTNTQTATTGDALVRYNTEAGDASTGDAANTNSFAVNATVSNNSAATLGGQNWTMPSVGSINTTGPGSDNDIVYHTDLSTYVSNDNDIHITNTNTQTATSGDATVRYNTTGGSASTGDATNTNSTSVTLNVSN